MIFSSDPEVIKGGSDMIRILFATAFFIGIPVVSGGSSSCGNSSVFNGTLKHDIIKRLLIG